MRLSLIVLTTLATLATLASAASASACTGALQEVSTTRKAAPTAKLPAPVAKAGFTATVTTQTSGGAAPNKATKAPAKKEEAKKE